MSLRSSLVDFKTVPAGHPEQGHSSVPPEASQNTGRGASGTGAASTYAADVAPAQTLNPRSAT